MAAKALQVLVLAVVPCVQCFRNVEPTGDLNTEDANLVKKTVADEVRVVEQKIEAVAGELENADAKTKPIKGTFQVGDSMEVQSSALKLALSIWHDKSAPSTGAWWEVKLKAKSTELGARFTNSMNTKFAEFQGFDRYVKASAQGSEVTLKTMPSPCDENFTRALENFAKHTHHVEVTWEDMSNVDVADLFREHSDKLILQELYKGLKVTVDAALSDAAEEAFGLLLAPEQSAKVVQVLARLFQGAFFDVRVQYDSKAVRGVLSSEPGIDTTFGGAIEELKQSALRWPDFYRRHPLTVMLLDVLQEADACLENIDSLEAKGLPFGVRAMLKWEHPNPFAVVNTVIKEAGVDKVLRDEVKA